MHASDAVDNGTDLGIDIGEGQVGVEAFKVGSELGGGLAMERAVGEMDAGQEGSGVGEEPGVGGGAGGNDRGVVLPEGGEFA